MNNDSLWLSTTIQPEYPPLLKRIQVDVVVVGAGITGVTTAWLLNQAGCRVALVDHKRIARGDTAHTTAHVTYVTDERLHNLVKRFGEDAARAFWEAGRQAMEQIERLTGKLGFDCELREVPGYLFASTHQDATKERDGLLEDTDLANRLGFDAVLVESDPLFGRPAGGFPTSGNFTLCGMFTGSRRPLMRRVYPFSRIPGRSKSMGRGMSFARSLVSFATIP